MHCIKILLQIVLRNCNYRNIDNSILNEGRNHLTDIMSGDFFEKL